MTGSALDLMSIYSLQGRWGCHHISPSGERTQSGDIFLDPRYPSVISFIHIFCHHGTNQYGQHTTDVEEQQNWGASHSYRTIPKATQLLLDPMRPMRASQRWPHSRCSSYLGSGTASRCPGGCWWRRAVKTAPLQLTVEIIQAFSGWQTSKKSGQRASMHSAGTERYIFSTNEGA